MLADIKTTTSKPSRDQLRRLLVNAINARENVRQALERLQALLAGAQNFLVQQQQRLDKYFDVDGKLAAAQLSIEKVFASSGGATRQSLPFDLVERVKERDECAAHVAAASNAVIALKQDVDHQRRILLQHENACAQAAGVILAFHSIGVAAELRAAQDLVFSLTHDLVAIGRIWIPAGEQDHKPKPITLPLEVINSIGRQEKQTAPSQNPEHLAIKRWSCIMRELCRSADFDLNHLEEDDHNEQNH
jgi:hypothetical protein